MTLPHTTTLIASHRGGTHLWPENSLLAFRETALLPVDYVEFDVHETADGILIVHHDATIDRMTDGAGTIADMNFASLRERIIIGAGGETIPTLEETIGIFKPSKVDLRLELKTTQGQKAYKGMEAKVAAELARHNMLSRTLVTSFAVGNLARFRSACSNVDELRGLMWLVAPALVFMAGLDGVVAAARAHDISEVGLNAKYIDQSCLSQLREAGFVVHAWAAHTRAEAARMFALGVASFTTDRPDFAIEARQALAAGSSLPGLSMTAASP